MKTWWFLENSDGAWLENAAHGTFTRDPNEALKWENRAWADHFRGGLRHPLWTLRPTEHAWVGDGEAIDWKARAQASEAETARLSALLDQAREVVEDLVERARYEASGPIEAVIAAGATVPHEVMKAATLFLTRLSKTGGEEKQELSPSRTSPSSPDSRRPEALSPAGGRTFLIAPVRGYAPERHAETVAELERQGWRVHWPARDTEQDDASGLRICRDNAAAIAAADVVHVIWDGVSQGCLFDLGVAFALGKPVVALELPPETEGKSFQNMVRAWAM